MMTSYVQKLAPVKAIHQHLCAFHSYANDRSRIVEAHHFCSHVSDKMFQCTIYDSDQSNARLIGVEYVITHDLFKSLHKDEKKLWHPHVYEIKSGLLVAPRLPYIADDIHAQQLLNTYGKTYHMWQVDRGDALPLGEPQLMASFTKDGQIPEAMVQERNKRYAIDGDEVRKRREDWEFVPVDPDCLI